MPEVSEVFSHDRIIRLRSIFTTAMKLLLLPTQITTNCTGFATSRITGSAASLKNLSHITRWQWTSVWSRSVVDWASSSTTKTSPSSCRVNRMMRSQRVWGVNRCRARAAVEALPDTLAVTPTSCDPHPAAVPSPAGILCEQRWGDHPLVGFHPTFAEWVQHTLPGW